MPNQDLANEDRYKLVFETSTDAVMLLGEKGFFDCNPATLKIFGFTSKEEFCTKGPADLSPPTQPDGSDSLTSANKKVADAYEKGSNFFEWVHKRSNGENFLAEVLLTAFNLDGKQVVQATVRDISDRKNLEEKAMASELRYRRLFETAQDGVLLIDYDTGMILDVNPFLITLLGYSKEDFLKKYLWEVGVFKDVAASKENFSTLQNKKYVRFEDLPLETKTGNKIDVEFVANAYQVGSTTIIQCNIRDISKRKKVEEELSKVMTETGRLAAIVETSDEAILSKDLNGIILTWNKGAEKMYGYMAGEIIGESVETIMPDSVKGEQKTIVGRILKGEIVKQYETQRLRKDGTILDVELSASPVKDMKGDIIAIAAIARDISEQKRVRENTVRMNKLMIGRELRMIELKNQIIELKKQIHGN